MKVQQTKKVRKLNKKAVAILTLIVAVLITGVTLLILDPFNKYPRYMRKVDNSLKQAGTHEVTKTMNDNLIQVSHYPKFKSEAMDTWVAETLKNQETQALTQVKEGTKTEVLQDYTSENVFDMYTSVVVKTQVNKETIAESGKVFFKKEGTAVEPSNLFNHQGARKLTYDIRKDLTITNENRNALLNATKLDAQTPWSINKESVSFYPENKAITFNFKDITDYLEDKVGDYTKTDGAIPPVYLDEGVSGSEKLVAFTFDDGPHPENTKRAMDILEKYNGKGTFFVVGERVEGNAGTVRDVINRGHQIASHSYDHPNLNGLPVDQVQKQINETEALIRKVSGYEHPIMVRPPYGAANETVRNSVDVSFVNWSIDSEDWRSHNAESICNIVDTYQHDGAIVLMHDLYKTTIDGFECSIEKLSQKGYKFVTVEELLKARNIPIENHKLYFDGTKPRN